MMLARVADSLYWIGRYVERAEHFSRLADVMLNATLDQSDASGQAAYIALAAVNDEPDLERSPYEAAKSLIFDREDPNSVVMSLALARENARQVRDQITTETWERLNMLFLRTSADNAERTFDNSPSTYLHEIIADLHLFKGAADVTMSHGEGWRFLTVGSYIERAQLIAALLEVCFSEKGRKTVGDHIALMSLLRMACALEPYLRVYTAEIQPRYILEFLLFDEEFPRSIRFATAQLEVHLAALARHMEVAARAGPDRLAGRLSARLQFADVEELKEHGASQLLATVTAECVRIHQAVYETFVAYPLEQRLPA
ncbi:MAG: hypothetical protein JWM33_3629 [Caulobacteraceae bacterium]|nr:hypothetical protein [Caulobacteraceae bacterium]